jgi:coproporphyrinogen III oxidase
MQEQLVAFLKQLREEIITCFEAFETKGRFQRTPWTYHAGEGGGEIAVLRGAVFEKAAVNWSGVSGDRFPMQDGEGHFFATGISLITHMQNPHAPTVHMNIRYIETEKKQWFGGGYDLTPMGFFYEEDKAHFHAIAQKTLGTGLYAEFSKNAAEYFYIPHRKKERGVGGIFFDHFNTGNFQEDLQMWQNVGTTFLEAIMPIYQRRAFVPFSEEDKAKQQIFRAHYVEFNLLYDRGTQFGFKSGGNPEAILCSLPPHASW